MDPAVLPLNLDAVERLELVLLDKLLHSVHGRMDPGRRAVDLLLDDVVFGEAPGQARRSFFPRRPSPPGRAPSPGMRRRPAGSSGRRHCRCLPRRGTLLGEEGLDDVRLADFGLDDRDAVPGGHVLDHPRTGRVGDDRPGAPFRGDGRDEGKAYSSDRVSPSSATIETRLASLLRRKPTSAPETLTSEATSPAFRGRGSGSWTKVPGRLVVDRDEPAAEPAAEVVDDPGPAPLHGSMTTLKPRRRMAGRRGMPPGAEIHPRAAPALLTSAEPRERRLTELLEMVDVQHGLALEFVEVGPVAVDEGQGVPRPLLCPAVMAIPPPGLPNSAWRMGVGQTPASRTAAAGRGQGREDALWSMGPDGRVSRATRTRPSPRNVPKAQAKSMTSSGVMVSPTMPRTPGIPILRSFTSIRQVFASGRFGLFQPFSRAAFFKLVGGHDGQVDPPVLLAAVRRVVDGLDIKLDPKSSTETRERQPVRTLLIKTSKLSLRRRSATRPAVLLSCLSCMSSSGWAWTYEILINTEHKIQFFLTTTTIFSRDGKKGPKYRVAAQKLSLPRCFSLFLGEEGKGGPGEGP